MLHYIIGTYHKHLRMNMEDGLVEELCMVLKLQVSSFITILCLIGVQIAASSTKKKNHLSVVIG